MRQAWDDGMGPSERELALLLAWFSPAFPIGAFSYSHGLEYLESVGALKDVGAAREAITAAAQHGAGFSDAVLLAHAFRAATLGDQAALRELTDLALALCPSKERREEAVYQGNAFAELSASVFAGATPDDSAAVPLPIAVGVAGAQNGVRLGPLCQAFVYGFTANLVSAAVRLVPLGQTDGQRLTRDLAPVGARVAQAAMAASLDDVGGVCLGLDVASMRHEDQYVRLFRS